MEGTNGLVKKGEILQDSVFENGTTREGREFYRKTEERFQSTMKEGKNRQFIL